MYIKEFRRFAIGLQCFLLVPGDTVLVFPCNLYSLFQLLRLEGFLMFTFAGLPGATVADLYRCCFS